MESESNSRLPDVEQVPPLRVFSSVVREVDMTDNAPDTIIVSNDPEVIAMSSTAELPRIQSVAAIAEQNEGRRSRRTRVPDRTNHPLNLWSLLKNCLGKELTKIPLPVNFSEPLSMLQRLTEDYEYAYILDHAATLKNPYEKLAYVAVFTATAYSTSDVRTGKPFNPLLGETYECDRSDDLGWKAISEQVSHHPPIVAQHCEGKQWKCWQDFSMESKFRGKYLQIKPIGTAHLVFDSGNHYTWTKVRTTVYNIIIGKLWIDHDGVMDIIDHTEGAKCILTYFPYTYFNRESQRRVKGHVMDKEGVVKWIINGHWNSKIEMAPVISVDDSGKTPVYVTEPFKVAWERLPAPSDSDKYYNFTLLSCQLNEPEEGVAPTDSRNRPDQRLMEEGRWDQANETKLALEEKQRQVRNEREKLESEAKARGEVFPPYEPLWFRQQADPITGDVVHMFTGEYWTEFLIDSNHSEINTF